MSKAAEKVVLQTAGQVEELIEANDRFTDEYCAAVSRELACRETLTMAQQQLDQIGSDKITDAALAAKHEKAGPLHGIASSNTKLFNAAVNAFLSDDEQYSIVKGEVHMLESSLKSSEMETEQARRRMYGSEAALRAKQDILIALANVRK